MDDCNDLKILQQETGNLMLDLAGSLPPDKSLCQNVQAQVVQSSMQQQGEGGAGHT